MGKFHDTLGAVGEEGYGETFSTDITAAYDEDMSIPGAKIQFMEQALAEAQAENIALKAANYDLLMSVSSESTEDEDTDGDSDGEDNDDEPSVEGLFGDDD